MVNKNRHPEWLAQERERQIQRLVGRFVVDDREIEGRNLHLVLGVSKDEYIDSIPPLPPQPERWRGRFDFPVVVDPRVGIKKLVELLKFIPIADFAVKWERTYGGIILPDSPYWIWAQDGGGEGRRYANIAALDWWEKKCAENERGLTLREALFLFYQQPDINLSPYWFAAPGSVMDRKFSEGDELVPLPETLLDQASAGGWELPKRDFGEAVPCIEYTRLRVSDRILEGMVVGMKPFDRADPMIAMTSCGDWTKIKDAPE
jgi:hypothetical protein